MTIICIKNGIIAADGAVTCSHTIDAKHVKKIVRSQDGAYGACAGLTSTAKIFRRMFSTQIAGNIEEGDHFINIKDYLEPDEEMQAVWLTPGGEIWRMGHNGIAYTVGEDIVAVGTSEDFALGAMRAGASAEEAVRLTIEHTVYAGGDVQVETIHPAPRQLETTDEHTGQRDDEEAFDSDVEAWRRFGERQGLV